MKITAMCVGLVCCILLSGCRKDPGEIIKEDDDWENKTPSNHAAKANPVSLKSRNCQMGTRLNDAIHGRAEIGIGEQPAQPVKTT